MANGETYDAIVARLERVVGELESGQLSLEQSIEKFAEGVRLARTHRASSTTPSAASSCSSAAPTASDEAVPFEPESAGKGG